MMVSQGSDEKAAAAEQPSHSNKSEPLICERWMTRQVHSVKPLDSIAHARALLEVHRINQLPVVKGGVLVGIVTDRDLRDAVATVTTSAKLAGTAENAPHRPEKIPVEAVMTHNVHHACPSQHAGKRGHGHAPGKNRQRADSPRPRSCRYSDKE
jgi:CBS domain-containing protein